MKNIVKPTGINQGDRSTVIKAHETIISVKGKNPAAVELGRLGGLKGGKARADSLTPERRKAIARMAANKRWAKDSN
jgi:hypothetical protein